MRVATFLNAAAFTAPAVRRQCSISLHALPPTSPPPQSIAITSSNINHRPILSKGNSYHNSIIKWLMPAANAATITPKPTDTEVKLLQDALGTLYGEKNAANAEPLLNEAILAWERQPADERAALYRVRGDCRMELSKPDEATADFSETISLLNGPGGEAADPSELPAAHLGRARALRMKPSPSVTPELAKLAVSDYEMYLRLSARGDAEDFDSDQERIADGASRNPYAAWEYAASLRVAKDYDLAAVARELASDSFDLIGDRARSVISDLDRGVDLAIIVASKSSSKESTDFAKATEFLEKAISKTTKVEGRDVQLLQRVIAKEGEARMALASILWDANDKVGAERQLGEACTRLEQLDIDDGERQKIANDSMKKGGKGSAPVTDMKVLKFSIDAGVGAGEISCARFKNEQFVTDALGWPDSLKGKVMKLQKLGR